MAGTLAARPASRIAGASVVVTGGALLTAVAVGTLLAHSLALGVAAAGAVIVLTLIARSVPAGLAIWILLVFVARLPGLGGVQNRMGLLVLLTWIGWMAAVHRRGIPRPAIGRFPALVLAFIGWVIISMAWAEDTHLALILVRDLVYDAIFVVIAVTALRRIRDARLVMLAFVFGAVLSVVAGAVVGGLSTTTLSTQAGRFSGGAGDPNYLAAVLVPAIVLAGSMASRASTAMRVALGLSVVVIGIGLAATGSRGGLLSAGAVAVLALVVWREQRRAIAAFLIIAAVAVGGWFAISPGAWDRVTSFGDKGNGRPDLWLVAWHIVEAHPVVGIGVNQFPAESSNYVQLPGSLHYANLIVDDREVVHNAYLQLWTETGIIGLALFIALAAASLRACRRATELFEAAGRLDLAALSRGAFLATSAALMTSFFLSNLSDRRVWVLLTLGPVLMGIARRPRAQLPTR